MYTCEISYLMWGYYIVSFSSGCAIVPGDMLAQMGERKKRAMKMIKGKAKVGAALCALLIAGCGMAMAGCSQASDNGQGDGQGQSTQASETAEPEELNADSHLFELMGQLASAKTVEEADQVIGAQGEERESTVEGLSSYYWDLGNDTGIEGTFFESGSSRYDASYPTEMVGPRADFSRWEEIKTKTQSADGITYDEIVELVGGVPGLKDTVSGDGVTYQWYDANGGYLFAQANSETGKCGTVSGRF